MRYKFKRNSWHCKAYEYIWDVNPMDRYKTMCPYFWSGMLTLIFFPLWALAKGGCITYEYARDSCTEFKENRRITKIKNDKEFVLANLTNYLALHRRFGDYYNFSKWVPIDDREKFMNAYFLAVAQYNNTKEEKQNKRELNISSKLENTRDFFLKNFLGKLVLYLTGLTILIGALWFVAMLCIAVFHFVMINWKIIGLVILVIAAIVALIALLNIAKNCWGDTVINWFITTEQKIVEGLHWLFNKLGVLKYLFYPFLPIVWGVMIVYDMIYAFYKQQCPIIEWEE